MNHAQAALQPWLTFYEMSGSAAAALTGVMFVVITLITGTRRAPRAREGTAAFSTPTVVHFGAALLVAAIVCAPWRSLIYPRVLLAVAGIYGIVYIARIAYRIRKMSQYDADLEDWAWHTCLPILSYAALVLGALLLAAFPIQAPFAFAAAVITLLFVGIHNAWDIVTFITVEQPARDAEAGDTSSAAKPVDASANGEVANDAGPAESKPA